jgi:ABC-2 type transport system permease protein
MMFYFMSESIDINCWGIPAGLALMILSGIKIGVVWSAARIVGTAVLLLSSSLIVDALMIGASSTVFWFTNAHSLLQLVSRFRENARYPLSIYSVAFRVIFSVIVPIGFVAFYPVQWILRPGEAGVAPFLTPAVGVACFALAYLLWHRGTRKWSGTGT